MKNTLRQSMAWLHNWAGLLAGWILFAMFLTGTASYFRPEISAWMRPELAQVTDADQAILKALDHLARHQPDATQWTVMAPDTRGAGVSVFWQQPQGEGEGRRRGRFGSATLDPATGDVAQARETRGGEFFYRFHFQLQLPHPWGRWLAGVCAMLMLAAIISGVITHKRIFADFFTFRPRKGQRSWLDAHNVTAVLALPFHVMITYTGLVTLMLMYMPWGIMANYKDSDSYFAESFRDPPAVEATGTRVDMVDFAPLLRQARDLFGGARIGRISVSHPGDAAAQVEISPHGGTGLSYRHTPVVFAATDGRMITAPVPHDPAFLTGSVMVGLHMGLFAGPVLRWLYFIAGLAGSAMVGTGLVLWAVKRRTPMPASGRLPFGQRLVEILNIGTLTGLPAGMAAFFLANRLIPAGLEGRADMEVAATFWVWGLFHLFALVRPARRAWIEGFALAGLLFLILPLVNLFTSPRHLGVSLPTGDWFMVSFDCAFWAVGFSLMLIARTLQKRPAAPVRKARPQPANLSAEAAE